MRKPIIILSSLFLFSTLLHISCSKNDDDCGRIARTTCYKMKNVQALPYNFSSGQIVASTDTVTTYDFALQLNIENESVMCLNKSSSLNLINTAYACTPVPQSQYKAELLDYTIKSDKALNSDLSVADDLKKYFKVPDGKSTFSLYGYFDYHANEPNYTHYLKFNLNVVNPDVYQFTVTFIYEDGTRETATTNPVRLVM